MHLAAFVAPAGSLHRYGAEERQSGPERSVNLHAPLAILLEPLQELLPDHALLTSHALQHVLDACT